MREWGKYIEANSKKNVESTMAFFDYLYKQYPNFPEDKIEKEYIAERIYPKEKNGVKKIDNLIYKFWIILEDFIVKKELENQPRQRELILLDALKNRKLDKYFFKKVDDLEKDWTANVKDGAENYLNLYRLKKRRIGHLNFDKTKIAYKINGIVKEIEKYYLSQKMIYEINDFVSHTFVKKKEEIASIIPIKSLLLYAKGNRNIHINIYTKILKLRKIDTNRYNKIKLLKENFLDVPDVFSDLESDTVIECLIILLVEEYSKGNSSALKDIFDLYKFLLGRGEVYKKSLDSNSFQNIVNIACALNEIDWVKNFINETQIYLDSNIKQLTLALSWSSVYIRTKEFQKILEQTSSVNFQNDFNNAFMRSIQLIAYFELEGYDEIFISNAKAFNLFLLRNKKIAKDHNKSFNNFVNFIRRLHKHKYNKKSNLSELEDSILKCDKLIYKSWLTEKISEMNNID